MKDLLNEIVKDVIAEHVEEDFEVSWVDFNKIGTKVKLIIKGNNLDFLESQENSLQEKIKSDLILRLKDYDFIGVEYNLSPSSFQE